MRRLQGYLLKNYHFDEKNLTHARTVFLPITGTFWLDLDILRLSRPQPNGFIGNSRSSEQLNFQNLRILHFCDLMSLILLKSHHISGSNH